MSIFSHALQEIEAGMTHLLHTFQHDAAGVKTLVKSVPINLAAHTGAIEQQALAFGYKLVKMTDDEVAAAKAELDAKVAALAPPPAA